MQSLAFTTSVPVAITPSNRAQVSHCNTINMGMHQQKISRRRLGQIAIGASAALVSYTATAPTVNKAIAEAKKRPAFIKDESGISYYDVKTGSGAGPADGDFVVVDYVSCKAYFILQLIAGCLLRHS